MHASNRSLRALPTVLALLLLLSGCTHPLKPAEATAVREQEVVLAAPRDLVPGGTDPYYTSSILYVWEPLVGVDAHGHPVPKLARSWEMAAGGKEWTFHLRQGVWFHDGTPFNADAVLANFARYRKISPRPSPFYAFSIERFYPGLNRIEKVDSYTVRLHFREPQPTLLFSMVNFGSAMFSPTNFTPDGNFNGLPQGTGPFRLVGHEKDQYALLERFERYYGEKARARRIRVRVIPSPDTRLSALKAEEIFGVMDLGAMPPAMAPELVRDGRFAISTARSTITHYLSANGNRPPFDNQVMKQAVSLALDRKHIANTLYGGYAQPTGNLLNGASPFARPIAAAYDREKALQLAAVALGGHRQAIDLIMPTGLLDRYPYKAQAELIQHTLRELGLDVRIRVLDGPAFSEALKRGDFHLAMHIQGLPNFEPLTIFQWFMHSQGATNKNYNLGYRNAEVDDLLARAAITADLGERRRIYERLQEIAARELPTIPLFDDVNLVVYNKRLRGYTATLYGITLPAVEWAS